jgi:hypothetical protein
VISAGTLERGRPEIDRSPRLWSRTKRSFRDRRSETESLKVAAELQKITDKARPMANGSVVRTGGWDVDNASGRALGEVDKQYQSKTDAAMIVTCAQANIILRWQV